MLYVCYIQYNITLCYIINVYYFLHLICLVSFHGYNFHTILSSTNKICHIFRMTVLINTARNTTSQGCVYCSQLDAGKTHNWDADGGVIPQCDRTGVNVTWSKRHGFSDRTPRLLQETAAWQLADTDGRMCSGQLKKPAGRGLHNTLFGSICGEAKPMPTECNLLGTSLEAICNYFHCRAQRNKKLIVSYTVCCTAHGAPTDRELHSPMHYSRGTNWWWATQCFVLDTGN